MQFITLPDLGYLYQRFDYDPASGELRWKAKQGCDRETNRWNAKHAGKIAGSINILGHRTVHLDSVQYYAHRIIWYMMTGNSPPEEIDHKNGKYADNRWENLRLANRSQQRHNIGKRRNNTSGYIGVSWSHDHQKWFAQIVIEGRRVKRGYFDTPEEAAEIYRRIAQARHGEFIHPSLL